MSIGIVEKAGGAAKAAGLTAAATGAAAVGGATFAGHRILDVGGSAVGSLSLGASSFISKVGACTMQARLGSEREKATSDACC